MKKTDSNPNLTTYLWIVLLFTAQASPATTATILDSDLTTKRITIQSLYDGRLSYFGADRQLRSARLDRFMQIRILPAPASRSHNDANPSSAPAHPMRCARGLAHALRAAGHDEL